MAWTILLLSGALETVWAAALEKSEHFSRRGPVAVFLLAQTLSLLGLAWAMREIRVNRQKVGLMTACRWLGSGSDPYELGTQTKCEGEYRLHPISCL
ncbi:DMT family transporter [Actinotignum sp. GS-2025c]|uniref:DMT family transporter n=1 Tax=Actinotignum sp. GS-2025c TaxID=3427276 RepID=UPI003F4471D7